MRQKSNFIFIFLLYFSNISFAQLEKTIHQTFEVKEKTVISLDLIGDSTLIVPWAGNTILTETKIELYDASPSILKHYIEKDQRYVIEADTTGSSLLLFSKTKERKPIKTQKGACFEQVKIRVFVPEDFKQESLNKYVKTE